ncbi:MAG: hypothetical protein Q9162_004351 [Coniocarpon cinnabarinum]
MNGHAGYRVAKAGYRQPRRENVDESDERTDHRRWRLLDERGRQRWIYLHNKQETESWPQSTADKYHLGMNVDLPTHSRAESPLDSVTQALAFFQRLQLDPGNWACEYGGPLFLLPGFVIAWFVTGTKIPDERRIEICNYLWAQQNEDGGWGLHIEGESTVFGTAMNYTTLRLLDQDAEDLRLIKARGLLHKMGGAIYGPHWAKFWLAVLGVCEWDAVNPVPPELWDNYHPKTTLLNIVNYLLVNVHTPLWSRTPLKQRAEDYAYQLIQWEDENTDYACLGPVNAPMNTIACFIREGADSYPVRRHRERLDDFLWMTRDGMLCNGTNGVQTWDTAFLVQAVVSAGLAEDPQWRPMLKKALEFLDDQQIREEPRTLKEGYRQSRKGAWAFSTREQGYTVSDCVSEGMKAVMMLQALPGYPQLVSRERLQDAVDVLLTMQNPTGGFGSYEARRGNPWLLEQFNAAEVFGKIMVEYDYPECTTAVVTALNLFKKFYPDYRAAEINRTVGAALHYIRDAQRPDGSWYGAWGICFTYAAMFALEALASAGETYTNSERVRRACKFLLDHQNEDGGWGESYKSCEDEVWRDHPNGSQVVNTAFAAIALMEAGFTDPDPLERGLGLIMRRQGDKGQWEQESIEGVFNKSCMISYPNYKFIFPVRALGMYAMRSGNVQLN